MYITNKQHSVFINPSLVSLVPFYNPEIFDLIADSNFNKTCTPLLVFFETSDMKWVKDTIASNGQLHIIYLSWLKYLFKAIHSKFDIHLPHALSRIFYD